MPRPKRKPKRTLRYGRTDSGKHWHVEVTAGPGKGTTAVGGPKLRDARRAIHAALDALPPEPEPEASDDQVD